MNNKEVLKEVNEFINNSINARLENDLPIIKDQLIKKSEMYLNLLNEENNTLCKLDIEKLVNKELYKIIG